MSVPRVLLEHLIDYAGLFPPAQLPMQQAVEEFEGIRSGAYAWISGRFIVPASRITELTNCLDGVEPFRISVIVDAGSDARDWLGTVQDRMQNLVAFRDPPSFVVTEALEVAVPAPVAARETFDSVIGQFAMASHNANLRHLPTYVELPRTNRFEELLPSAMFALSRSRLGAKLRCGGIEQSALPTSREIATFLLGAHEHGVPFKATAGLHHPVRGVDRSSGLLMHGFLNLLAASIATRRGADLAQLEAILEERDPHAFRVTEEEFSWQNDAANMGEVSEMRASAFRSYGSCSFSEPIDDLISCGALAASSAAV